MSRIRELREELHISQDQLASLAEVSRHAVIRSEQLCYSSPLPSIVQALSDLTGLSENEIVQFYLNDVKHNRIKAGLLLFPFHNYLLALTHQLIVSAGTMVSQHPFAIWRMTCCDLLGVSTSQVHFSIMTSIHPATLSKYEAFKTGFPGPIGLALTEMNLPSEQITLFETQDLFNWRKD